MGFISPLACIGDPPEQRDHIWPWYTPGLPQQTFIRPVIDDTAIVNAFVTIDASRDKPTRVGANTLLMKRVHVGHDAQVGDGCELAVGCIIGGNANVGNNVRIGLGAVVLPRVTIGDGARIGAGAVVTKDVPSGETWVGVPARRLVKAR